MTTIHTYLMLLIMVQRVLFGSPTCTVCVFKRLREAASSMLHALWFKASRVKLRRCCMHYGLSLPREAGSMMHALRLYIKVDESPNYFKVIKTP